MQRFFFTFALLLWPLVGWGDVPLHTPQLQLTNIARSGTLTVSGALGAPASTVTVNGQQAERYADLTFARTNNSLSGSDSFTVIAQNQFRSTTNILNTSLPASVTLRWDANGNLTNDGTRAFFYDAYNRVTNVTAAAQWKVEFVYDGLGRRRIMREYGWQGSGWGSPTNETRYLYDGLLPIQERNGTNAILASYTRGLDLSGTLQGAGGVGGLLARTDSTGLHFYHADGAGNITALIGGQGDIAARYMCDPFGRLVGKWGSMADANEMQFSSMPVHRQSGTIGYFGRAYDPNLQRWLQRDPVGEGTRANLYQFNFNNPLSFIDPDGLAPQLVSVTADANGRQLSSGYVNYTFGQDFGIGLHGPLGSGGEATVLLGASMVPPVGEILDWAVLRDPESRWWEKGIAGVSLGANALTDGLLPNAGGLLRAGKPLCKDAVRLTGEALEKARREFNAIKPQAWMQEAARNPGKYAPEQLVRMRQGHAPTGADNFPMEIHHKRPLAEGGANSIDNFEFLTRTEHRLAENYKLNHPNLP